MSLAVAIQMDPIETINIDADSSFVLGLEAQRRGHGLFHYLPRDMFFRDGRVFATARPMKLKRERGNHHEMGKSELTDQRHYQGWTRFPLVEQDYSNNSNEKTCRSLYHRLLQRRASI